MKQKIGLQLQKALEGLWERPWLTVVILAIPTLFFGYFLLHLKVGLRQQAMFDPDDPELRGVCAVFPFIIDEEVEFMRMC